MAQIPANYRRLEGSELKPAHEARHLGSADHRELVEVTVCVRQRPGGPPLPDHAHWMATPPGKRKFLSSQEFAARHGAAQEDLDAIARFARIHGLTVVETSLPGRTVRLSGTARQMSHAFAVDLEQYQPPEESYRSHTGPIYLPDEVADIVEAVFGLDNRRVGRRNSSGDPPGTSTLAPPQVATLYNFPPPPASINQQIIGIMEFGGGWSQPDIDNTLFSFGLATSTTPVDVNVTGSNNYGVIPGKDSESMLDICVAAAVAPGATIRVYWGSDPTSSSDWVAVLNAIITEPLSTRPSVVTTSWVLARGDDTNTLGLDGLSSSQVKVVSAKFQGLAALGVTVFAACGDDGARSDTFDSNAHVQYPGSDPWVTSCGGTTISATPAYVEWVWNDFNPTESSIPQATGGGVSALFTGSLPPWQQVVSIPKSLNDGTTIGRGVPDVAGNASLNSGYMIIVDTKSTGPLCGTSAVSPIYAGLMAIINASLGQPVGFLNPTLYAFRETVCRDVNAQAMMGSPPDNGVPAYTNPFTMQHFPAVKGYPSGAGWDACTGLGTIDGGALLAALQSVYQQDCQFILDRTQIGKDEVSETLLGSSPGIVGNAFYVVLDGFSASDPKLNITASDLFPNPPGVVPSFSVGVSGMSVAATALLAEDVSLPAKPQRFTWICAAKFATDLSAFSSLPRAVSLSASIAGISSNIATVELVQEGDPYELDGATSWLSADLRVFQMKTGGSLAGLPMVTLGNTGTPTVDAPTFIQAVIDGFNAATTLPPGHPFDLISTDEQVSEVTLNQIDFATGLPIYNFAVARVRYQGMVDSQPVRVFFRIFQASTTSTAYEPATYATVTNVSGSKIPVFGVDGSGNVVAIPCFGDARVSAGTSLTMQNDDKNVLAAGIKHDPGGGVVYRYFGCWLDINQSGVNAVPLPPVPVDSANPWANGSESVLAAIRSQHQCLVAEISYDADPVQPGETPASSDKLAQRNLAIVPSANPGNPASHRIPNTFEIRPTSLTVPVGEKPDELLIQWGTTPPGSVATIYLPEVSSAQVLELAAKMYVTQRLEQVDAHTLRCRTGGATWLPVPKSPGANFAGLLTVDLPATVRKGQVYTIVVRQLTNAIFSGGLPGQGRTLGRPTADAAVSVAERRVLGSFQLTIPVRVEAALLENEERLLAILRWIGQEIAPKDRWSPVFDRYVAQIAARVQGFGGDPAQIPPSPTGSIPGPIKHPIKRHELAFTGKVTGLQYDQFGDFEGFLLETEEGERSFHSREKEIAELATRAWRERLRLTVWAERDQPHRLLSIIIRQPPHPFSDYD
jgi:hypothetical protein